MRRSTKQKWIQTALVLMLSGLAIHAQSAPQPASSAKSSQPSATLVDEKGLTEACAAAADELAASRRLITLLERENRLIAERLETEIRRAELAGELLATRKAETDALREAIRAKDEVIAARSQVIDAQKLLIDELKKKQRSPWKRVTDILIGVAAGVVLR